VVQGYGAIGLDLKVSGTDRPTENPLFTFKKMSVFLLKGLSHQIDLDLKTSMVSSRPK
jgi:hypothetical protein